MNMIQQDHIGIGMIYSDHSGIGMIYSDYIGMIYRIGIGMVVSVEPYG